MPVPQDPQDSYPRMFRDNPNYVIRRDELMDYIRDQDIKYMNLLSRINDLEWKMSYVDLDLPD